MRVKIGTSIDEKLLKRAQAVASRERMALNRMLEDALRTYLDSLEARLSTGVAERTWGTSRIDAETLARIMEEDVFDT